MDIYSVILGPIESHKARELELQKVYTFRVANNATKTDIKRAFATLYDRPVVSVQIAKNYQKTKNAKKGTIRRRPSFKKAYVTLTAPIKHLAQIDAKA